MSNVEQLLKSSSFATPPSPTSAKDESNGDASVKLCDSPWKNNEVSIAKVVQDVVRSVCRERTSMTALQSSKSKWIDDCVEAVIRSNANNRLTKPQSFSEKKYADHDMVEIEDQAMDDMETPPKLTAINDEKRNFDQYRYRRRRKRRFFSGVRRPSRRYPMKLRPVTDVVDETEPPRRKRPKLANQDQHSRPVQNKKEEEVSLEAQVHNSVFSPDQCNLIKGNKHEKMQHENPNGACNSSNPLCWHFSLNEKLFPRFRDFKNGEISQANKWSVETVSEFVQSIPACPSGVAEKFRQEQIDGEAFLLLTQHDIVRLMNIRLGPAVKIHNAIMFLKHESLNSTH